MGSGKFFEVRLLLKHPPYTAVVLAGGTGS